MYFKNNLKKLFWNIWSWKIQQIRQNVILIVSKIAALFVWFYSTYQKVSKTAVFLCLTYLIESKTAAFLCETYPSDSKTAAFYL